MSQFAGIRSKNVTPYSDGVLFFKYISTSAYTTTEEEKVFVATNNNSMLSGPVNVCLCDTINNYNSYCSHQLQPHIKVKKGEASVIAVNQVEQPCS